MYEATMVWETGDVQSGRATGVVVVGYVLVGVAVVAFVGRLFWYHKKGGYEMWNAFVERKRDEREAQKAAEAGKKSIVAEYTA